MWGEGVRLSRDPVSRAARLSWFVKGCKGDAVFIDAARVVQNATLFFPPNAVLFEFLRVLQRLRGVRGQDDATETGRRVTS